MRPGSQPQSRFRFTAAKTAASRSYVRQALSTTLAHRARSLAPTRTDAEHYRSVFDGPWPCSDPRRSVGDCAYLDSDHDGPVRCVPRPNYPQLISLRAGVERRPNGAAPEAVAQQLQQCRRTPIITIEARQPQFCSPALWAIPAFSSP